MFSFDSSLVYTTLLLYKSQPEYFFLLRHGGLFNRSDTADISLCRSEDTFLLVRIWLNNLHWSPSEDVSVAWLRSGEVIFRSSRSWFVSVASDVPEDRLLGGRVSVPPGISLARLGSGLHIPTRDRPGPVHVSLLRLEDRSDWAGLSSLVRRVSTLAIKTGHFIN